jgi:hypothetical protein
VLPLVPREAPDLSDRVNSVYDRYLRATLHPLERCLWRRRLI